MSRLAAYWDWTSGAPVPDARIVVCAPGLFQACNGGALGGPPQCPRLVNETAWKMERAREAGQCVVVPDIEAVWWLAASQSEMPVRLLPALHITRQADLARLPGLLAVRAERWALVVSPEEQIDLETVFACPQCRGYGVIDSHNNPCVHCDDREPVIDVVFVVGLEKPVHPDWVRGAVEQCRKAGVPVVFLGWGVYAPIEPIKPSDPPIYFVPCGGARSGALLDGVVIEDEPAWLGGEG